MQQSRFFGYAFQQSQEQENNSEMQEQTDIEKILYTD